MKNPSDISDIRQEAMKSVALIFVNDFEQYDTRGPTRITTLYLMSMSKL